MGRFAVTIPGSKVGKPLYRNMCSTKLTNNFLGLTVVIAAVLLSAGQAYADSADIELGPTDRVRVTVHEWRPSEAQLNEWPGLSGEFEISAAGQLFMPLIGEITAEGSMPGQLARAIEVALQDKAGLTTRPTATVEIVRFRPIYAVGQVERPGEYDFRPGMTVLNALGLAGGMVRLEDAEPWSISRDTIAAAGEVRSVDLAMANLVAQRSRLQAESFGADTIEFSAELNDMLSSSLVSEIMQLEQGIFDARRHALKSQVDTLEAHKDLLRREIQSLLELEKVLAKQQASIEIETQSMRSLVERGLAAQSKELSLQREVDGFEADRIEIKSLVLRAQQDLMSTDLRIFDLRDKRSSEVAAQLQETRSKIKDLDIKRETAERLLINAGDVISNFRGQQEMNDLLQPTFVIVRQDGTEQEASEQTPLQPGDVVKILLGMPQASSATGGGRDQVSRLVQ